MRVLSSWVPFAINAPTLSKVIILLVGVFKFTLSNFNSSPFGTFDKTI